MHVSSMGVGSGVGTSKVEDWETKAALWGRGESSIEISGPGEDDGTGGVTMPPIGPPC